MDDPPGDERELDDGIRKNTSHLGYGEVGCTTDLLRCGRERRATDRRRAARGFVRGEPTTLGRPRARPAREPAEVSCAHGGSAHGGAPRRTLLWLDLEPR